MVALQGTVLLLDARRVLQAAGQLVLAGAQVGQRGLLCADVHVRGLKLALQGHVGRVVGGQGRGHGGAHGSGRGRGLLQGLDAQPGGLHVGVGLAEPGAQVGQARALGLQLAAQVHGRAGTLQGRDLLAQPDHVGVFRAVRGREGHVPGLQGAQFVVGRQDGPAVGGDQGALGRDRGQLPFEEGPAVDEAAKVFLHALGVALDAFQGLQVELRQLGQRAQVLFLEARDALLGRGHLLAQHGLLLLQEGVGRGGLGLALPQVLFEEQGDEGVGGLQDLGRLTALVGHGEGDGRRGGPAGVAHDLGRDGLHGDVLAHHGHELLGGHGLALVRVEAHALDDAHEVAAVQDHLGDGLQTLLHEPGDRGLYQLLRHLLPLDKDGGRGLVFGRQQHDHHGHDGEEPGRGQRHLPEPPADHADEVAELGFFTEIGHVFSLHHFHHSHGHSTVTPR
ncbi:hypothetical protein DSECCO2_511060 [anaerobic digester metagenome]